VWLKFHLGVYMLKGFKLLIQAGIGFAGCVAVIGFAQASTSLTAYSTVQGNTSWQDIAGTSYSFDDKNHDGKVNVGEEVKFTVDMHKANWGTHAYDALKFWIDGPSGNLLTKQDNKWIYDPSGENIKWFNQPGDTYSYRSGDTLPGGSHKLFDFYYTFDTVGVFDIVASVMCSRDLSDLVGTADDNPIPADWNAWHENTHQIYHDRGWWIQGETERYKLKVVASPVPEPQTYAMLLAGLGLMGFMVRRRKSLES
jgi:hypothetical protein